MSWGDFYIEIYVFDTVPCFKFYVSLYSLYIVRWHILCAWYVSWLSCIFIWLYLRLKYPFLNHEFELIAYDSTLFWMQKSHHSTRTLQRLGTHGYRNKPKTLKHGILHLKFSPCRDVSLYNIISPLKNGGLTPTTIVFFWEARLKSSGANCFTSGGKLFPRISNLRGGSHLETLQTSWHKKMGTWRKMYFPTENGDVPWNRWIYPRVTK